MCRNFNLQFLCKTWKVTALKTTKKLLTRKDLTNASDSKLALPNETFSWETWKGQEPYLWFPERERLALGTSSSSVSPRSDKVNRCRGTASSSESESEISQTANSNCADFGCACCREAAFCNSSTSTSGIFIPASRWWRTASSSESESTSHVTTSICPAFIATCVGFRRRLASRTNRLRQTKSPEQSIFSTHLGERFTGTCLSNKRLCVDARQDCRKASNSNNSQPAFQRSKKPTNRRLPKSNIRRARPRARAKLERRSRQLIQWNLVIPEYSIQLTVTTKRTQEIAVFHTLFARVLPSRHATSSY